jgi:carbohydrate diacid regulator
MKITTGLALPIVNQLMSLLEFNVNIMDDNGIIVASGDPGRIGQQHEGALQVLSSKQQLVISEKDLGAFYGSKPGVNLPIEFQNKIVGVVGITGNPDEVYKFGTIIKMNVEVLLQQIYMNKQMQYRKMALEGWIMELISPYEFAEKKLEVTGKSLEIDVEIERCVILVEIEEMKWGDEVVNAALLQKINDRKDHFLNDLRILVDYKSIFTYVEEGTFFVAVPAKDDHKKEYHVKIAEHLRKLGYRFYIGIGNPRQGLIGYKESYNQALQCIRLMKKFNHAQKAYYIDDWGIIPFLDAIPQDIQQMFLAKYLPSHQAMNEEYKQTLKIFMECELDVKQTAALLHVHRNTLFYRLDKISQQLQLDYRKFNDLVVMKLLLIFDQLQK